MAKQSAKNGTMSPVGSPATEGAARRARRSAGYREAQERLAPYEQLARIVIRRRLDLGLTQEQLAQRMDELLGDLSDRERSAQHLGADTTKARSGARDAVRDGIRARTGRQAGTRTRPGVAAFASTVYVDVDGFGTGPSQWISVSSIPNCYSLVASSLPFGSFAVRDRPSLAVDVGRATLET